MALPGKLRITTICLHISAAVYVLIGLGCFVLFATLSQDEIGPFGWVLGLIMGLFSTAIALAIEGVVWGLRKLKYWAWIVGIVVCCLYIPGLFEVDPRD